MPSRRHLGNHVNTRAHVFRTLGIMGRSGQHLIWPELRSLDGFTMELLGTNAEAERVAANIVERSQAVVTIKRCILQSLRHQGAGVLLETHSKTDDGVLVKRYMSSLPGG